LDLHKVSMFILIKLFRLPLLHPEHLVSQSPNHFEVFIPVHVHGNHWCLAIINVELQRFEYYDSLQVGPGTQCTL
jgi:hypothetical protein